MPILSRAGPRLLRQVGGRAHAGEGDHEREDGGVRMGMSEEDIHAEPVSSGEEEDGRGRGTTVGRQMENGSAGGLGEKGRGNARGKGRVKKVVRAPARGTYQRGRGEKEKEKERENVGETEEEEKGIYFGMGSTPKKKKVGGAVFGKGAKRKAEEVVEEAEEGEGKIYWGMGDTPPKKARTMNVHGVAGAGARGFGKRMTFGRAKPSASAPLPQKPDLRHLDDLDAALSGKPSKDKDSALSSLLDPYDPYCSVSDSDSPSHTSPLAFPASAPTTVPTTTTTTPTPAFPYLSPDSPLTSPPALSPPPLSPTPSPPSYNSSATCPLCSAPVSPADQAAFYADRKRSVRNQMLFCRAHKRASALEAYRTAGYPDVDWGALPERIRAMRGELVGVLRGESGGGEEGVWRERFGERLRSGKGAVLGRGRKRGKGKEGEGLKLGELKEEVKGEKEVEKNGEKKDGEEDRDVEGDGDGATDLFSSTACLTGYYGPRGRRLFMETLTSELEGEIREAAARDPTVGRSGFAMFLQAVMVPELVVRLVMEDLEVGRAKAGEVVEESAEVGGLVHEEVEEVVEEEEDESEEEEY